VTVEGRESGTDDSATGALGIEDPNAEERAALEAHLETARGMIAEGVSAYRSRGDGAMTGVTAEDADASLSAVVEAVLPVSEELRAAREYDLAEEYADEIDRIEREAELLRELVYAQRHTFDVVEDFRGVLDRFDDESRGMGRFRQYEDRLLEFRRRIRGDSPGVVNMVAAATGGGHAAPQNRPQAHRVGPELQTFEPFETQAEETPSAIGRLESAREGVNLDDDLADLDRLPSTAAEFESIVDELPGTARDVRRETAGGG
jgi:hypothetical protein